MPAEFTTILGRLLTDPELRRRFRRDPASAARALDADPSSLAAIDPDGLDLQAETLLEKRLHEVSKLLPRTVAGLGIRGAPAFREYACAHWPEGHRRHAEDAAAFGSFLRERGFPLCRSELNRHLFTMGSASWAIHLVADARVGGRSRRAIQLLFRRRGVVRSLAVYLGL